MHEDQGACPTKERLAHAKSSDTSQKFYTDVGSRGRRRVNMLDDALGRAWVSRKISAEEYSALKAYAVHWALGGLQGQLASCDLNRIVAVDPSRRDQMFAAEAVCDHRDLYHRAKTMLGFRPSFVADQVACHGFTLAQTGAALGFRSVSRGRERAACLLSDAGSRLASFWRAPAQR